MPSWDTGPDGDRAAGAPVGRDGSAGGEPAAAPARVCTIDIGSNSARSLIVDATGPDQYRILNDERITTRLGEAVASSGFLSEAAMARTLDAIAKLLTIARGHGVEITRAVTTSAVRDARNREDFLGRIRERHGLELEIIDGEHEARLAFLSARRGLSSVAMPFCVMDLGGGSLELVLAAGGAVEQILSLPLGAVRLTEAFLRSDPPAAEELKSMRRFARRALRAELGRRPRPMALVVGSGGTVSALATMAQAATGATDLRLSGYELYRSEVQHLRDFLARKPLAERRKTPGLSPDRADIIVAGVTVVNLVMKELGANLLRHNARGVREGLLLETLAQRFGATVAPAPSRMQVVRRFASACHIEEPYAEHVARLALLIFDGLRRRFALTERDRELLEAAALLHDVGYTIDYAAHHKHSYHIIRHAPLSGFSARDVQLIALTARYHRAAEPKRTHEGFQKLDRADRRRVRRLAAILRLAVGLDRSHAAKVSTVEVTCGGDAIRVLARGEGDLSVEAWGVAHKQSLFRRAYGMPLLVEVRGTAGGPATSSPGEGGP
ncbi:MAG TPA: Ppx/GppA phosphatase family protein [Polyangia bacterium]|jgi:exopolyphosphatase/guanosine-5'-triphosphate,3'-diphosphate pyrophosphatase